MKKHLRGITLVELLVVLVIISILALISYAGLSGARTEAKKAAVKADMDALIPSAELYALTNAYYPYEYTNFCTSDAVRTVEEACIAVYASSCDCTGDDMGDGVAGACDAGETTWSVWCQAPTPGFSWTCENNGIKTYCH